ncbi:MAG: hypothetical protein ACI85O_000334 [Saprospiraceae bacterium]|jgi:hypothetical protein
MAANQLSAQIPYLEIKNHRAQTATYGQIDLSQKRGIEKYPKFEVNLPNVDTFAVNKITADLMHCTPDDGTIDILIYIHAMWGGADFFEAKVLRTFAPEILAPKGRIDKILPIIWHAGTNYKKNLPRAYKIGELLAENIGYVMQDVKANSKKLVRFHLLCHSMGHQVFRGIYSVNGENDIFSFGDALFGDVIFAAPDVAYDIFGTEWGGLTKQAERITYFVNENDRALKISEKKIKIKRLGREGSIVRMQDYVNEIDVSNIDDTKGLSPKYSGHGYFFASKTVRGIIIRLLGD